MGESRGLPEQDDSKITIYLCELFPAHAQNERAGEVRETPAILIT